MAKHGKKYLEAAKKIEEGRDYDPKMAVSLVKQTAYAKFDATVEVHIRLGVDPRHADQQLRGTVEIGLGPLVAGFYPVLKGLSQGDRIVTKGAFLVDAELRLNPGAASAYFGASGGPSTDGGGGHDH